MKPSVKYQVIFKHKDKYSVSQMCKFFGVSRSGYYAFLKRLDIPDRDLALANKIIECQEESNNTYGYRRVHIWLERQGIYHNPKTILRVMHKYPNLLNREFNADRPNQKWVTDISYIPTAQGNCYLSVTRDLYDNSIVSYQISNDMTVKLVFDTIKKAMKKEKVTTEQQLHSDQGSQYVSHEYHLLTKSYGITPSMSRRGNPYDNALAENFFSILKTECIHRVKLATYSTTIIVFKQKQN